MVKRVRPFFQRGEGRVRIVVFMNIQDKFKQWIKEKIRSIRYNQVVERETIKKSSELNCRFKIR